MVESRELMSRLGMHSKMNAHPAFINGLRDEGRQCAAQWLDENFHRIGVRSSFRLAKLFD
jgi:NTE family protein